MVVLSVIAGALLIIGGVACLFHPAATFFETGYFLAILMLVYGVVGIINVIRKRAEAIELLVHIPAVIIGVIAIIRPGTTLVLDGMMVYLVAAWFVIQGVVSIYLSIKVRRIQSGWIWGLILGILGLVLGIYSFIHPMVSALTIGILVGFYLIEAGLNMIVISTALAD